MHWHASEVRGEALRKGHAIEYALESATYVVLVNGKVGRPRYASYIYAAAHLCSRPAALQ